MEKLWNFEIGAKSHGKAMNRRRYVAAFQDPTNMYVDIEVVEFYDTVMEKSWIFFAKISWQPCVTCTASIGDNRSIFCMCQASGNFTRVNLVAVQIC